MSSEVSIFYCPRRDARAEPTRAEIIGGLGKESEMLINVVSPVPFQCSIRFVLSIAIHTIFQRPFSSSTGRLRRVHGTDGACKIELRIDFVGEGVKRNGNGIPFSLFTLGWYFRLIAAAWCLVFDETEESFINLGRGSRGILLCELN